MNRLSHSKIIPYNRYQGYNSDTNNYLYRVTDTDFDDLEEWEEIPKKLFLELVKQKR